MQYAVNQARQHLDGRALAEGWTTFNEAHLMANYYTSNFLND
jgi:hypothetical protein